MIDTIHRVHNELMLVNYEEGKNKRLNQTSEVLALNRERMLIPTLLHLSFNPFLDGDNMSYVGILKPINSFYEYIVINPEGII